MAQRIETLLLDDLEKSKGKEVPADESLEFSLEGRRYRIDLTKSNADKFRARMAPYTAAAERLPVNGVKPSRTAARRKRSALVRTWAADNGFEVSERGRIPAEIVAKYDAAH